MIEFTIFGEPASKANSRELVTIAGHAAFIKSEKARNYVREALLQIPIVYRKRLEGRVGVSLWIFYASERSDLDESVVLDVMQDQWVRVGEKRVLVQAGIYRNDRQVRHKEVDHAIDRYRPRCEVKVWALDGQLELEDEDDGSRC